MRALLTFAATMATGAIVAQPVKRIRPTFGAGYATGLAIMIGVALVINSHAACPTAAEAHDHG